MKTIYLVRHGQTIFNQEKRLQGWRDSPLSEQGIMQVEQVARSLTQFNIRHALVSPLGRAQQTAEIIRSKVNMTLENSPDLREVSFGDFEGNTLPDLDKKYPGQWEARMADKWNYCPPGGEANIQAIPRASNVVRRIDNHPEDEELLIVAHFAINRIILSLLAKIEPDTTIKINVPHTTIYRVQQNHSEWEISYWNTDQPESDFHAGWLLQEQPENLPTGG